MCRRFLVIVGCSTVAVGLLWLTEVPLGVPGEWTWNRIQHESAIESILGVVQALIVGALFIAVAWFGLSRVSRATRLELAGWLAIFLATALSWLIAVQEAAPEGYRLSKAPWVLYYPGMSGYFFKARYEISDTAEFLRNYQTLMAEGDVLHVGTHTPGMFLLYRGLLWITHQRPGLVPLLNWSQPASVRDGFEVIAVNSALQPNRALTGQDQAVLWLGTLLAHLSTCWVIVPLFGILRWTESRETAWKVVSFWPLIPAVLVFLPKDDVLFCGLVATFLWCWLNAARCAAYRDSKMSLLWGVVAATLGFVALNFSLVFLPVGLISLVASLLQSHDRMNGFAARLRLLWPACFAGALTVGGLILTTNWCCGLNLLAVWELNIRNHASFYEQYPRTVWMWLPTNAIELSYSLGFPVALLTMQAVAQCWRCCVSGPGMLSTLNERRARAIAVLSVWGLLWLTGKNSGEAARLWIPLMPLAVWLLPAALDSNPDDRPAQREWLCLLVLQTVVCLLTVIRVSGFHFGPG